METPDKERPFTITALSLLSLVTGIGTSVFGALLMANLVIIASLANQTITGLLVVVVGLLMVISGIALILLKSFAWLLYVIVSGIIICVFLVLSLFIGFESVGISLLIMIVSIILGYLLGQKEFFDDFTKK